MKATVKDDFKSANTFYSKAAYKQAQTIYLQLLKDGHFSSELYYNLGNTYYKMNEIPHAILYFEKAKKLTPLDEDIHHNLAHTYQLTVDRKDDLDNELLSAWWGTIVKYQPLNRWALYSVILCLFSSFMIVTYSFTQNRTQKKIAFYTFLFSFVACILAIFVGFQSKSILNTTTHGIIFSPSVTVLSEPVESSTKLFTLHEGAKVLLLNQEDSWQRIQFSDDKIGWIKNEVIEKI
jgi:hypothetical protein